MSCDNTYGVSFCGFDNVKFNHPNYPNINMSECCKRKNYVPEPPIGDNTYGVSFCGFDNVKFNHPNYPKINMGECCKPQNYFPETPVGDTNLYICNQDDTEKIFRRLECGQEVKPEYRPGFEVCRQQIDLNEQLTHPNIKMINPYNDLHNPFTPCKGDGLGYLERVLVDSELKCMNQYLSKVHETSAFKPKKLPNTATHNTYLSVANMNLGPRQVCEPLTINPCVTYPDNTDETEPYGLINIGELEKPINRFVTSKIDGPGMFLPIGPTRCDELNRQEMVWDNVTKRHHKDSIPNYMQSENQYRPREFEGHPVLGPPVCKYDYTLSLIHI